MFHEVLEYLARGGSQRSTLFISPSLTPPAESKRFKTHDIFTTNHAEKVFFHIFRLRGMQSVHLLSAIEMR